MIHKSTRKKFLEQKFKTIKEQDANWSNTWKNLRKQVNMALGDIKLLAEKLPEKEQSELFDAKILRLLFLAILEHRSFESKLDPRRARIAAMMVRIGLMECKVQYGDIEDEEVIRKKIINILDDTSLIISAIENKVYAQSKSH